MPAIAAITVALFMKVAIDSRGGEKRITGIGVMIVDGAAESSVSFSTQKPATRISPGLLVKPTGPLKTVPVPPTTDIPTGSSSGEPGAEISTNSGDIAIAALLPEAALISLVVRDRGRFPSRRDYGGLPST